MVAQTQRLGLRTIFFSCAPTLPYGGVDARVVKAVIAHISRKEEWMGVCGKSERDASSNMKPHPLVSDTYPSAVECMTLTPYASCWSPCLAALAS